MCVLGSGEDALMSCYFRDAAVPADVLLLPACEYLTLISHLSSNMKNIFSRYYFKVYYGNRNGNLVLAISEKMQNFRPQNL